MFVLGKPFKPSLMFMGKARAYSIGAPERLSSLVGKKAQYSGLLGLFISYKEKSFITLSPGLIDHQNPVERAVVTVLTDNTFETSALVEMD